MTIARRLGLVLLISCLGISVWWGSSIARTVPGGPLDFQAIYYGTLCLVQHHDPYNVTEVENVSRAAGGEHPSDSVQRRQTVTLYVNLPVTFLFIAPFTMLPLGAAQVLWLILTAGVLFLASVLIWNLGSKYAPILSGMSGRLLPCQLRTCFLNGKYSRNRRQPLRDSRLVLS